MGVRVRVRVMCLLGGSIVLWFLLETDDKLLQVHPGYHPGSGIPTYWWYT